MCNCFGVQELEKNTAWEKENTSLYLKQRELKRRIQWKWKKKEAENHSDMKSKAKIKKRNVHIRLPVSLELPGNLKVWLESHCQVIIAVKQSVSFYNYSEAREKREIYQRATSYTAKQQRLIKIDQRHEHGCFGQCLFMIELRSCV